MGQAIGVELAVELVVGLVFVVDPRPKSDVVLVVVEPDKEKVPV
jgi:hypothetical protein